MNNSNFRFPIPIEKSEIGKQKEEAMTTEKQIEANCKNAQLSTGPMTTTGKTIVSANAIKHGIFTKDLIVSSGIGQESQEEYQDILNNLIDCLAPCNQMESLLVEKIAVDFWRLRRIIRFETGSITDAIKKLLKEFYSHGNPDNDAIDEQIRHKQELIDWNLSYVEYLRKDAVAFDKPKWTGMNFESDIFEDLYMIARSISTLTQNEREMLKSYNLDFEKLRALLSKYGYSDSKVISVKLIELFSQHNGKLKKEIQQLSKQKLLNDTSDTLTNMLGMVPEVENTDKVLKYERSLQKSIFQNLFMLKKLQGTF